VEPGVHDLGGRLDHSGPIARDPRPAVFHHHWEARVFGMELCFSAVLDPVFDPFRDTLERLPRATYFLSYYERWLAGLERRLEALGYLVPGEIDARLAGEKPAPGAPPRRAPRLRPLVRRPLVRLVMRPLPRWLARLYPVVQGFRRRRRAPPAFAPGDEVIVRPPGEPGHTRRPAYLWGHRGVVRCDHGAMVFPDASARGLRGSAAHLYGVAFGSRELWGKDADPGLVVNVDLFEPYLEHAP